MEEATATPAAKAKKTNQRKSFDILVSLAFIVLCVVLAKNLINQLNLKHEVQNATAVTDQIIKDIRKNDGKAVSSLSNKTFSSENSSEDLSAKFKSIEKQTNAQSSVRHKIVTNDDQGQAVSIIYKFQSKPVIYIRVLVQKPNGTTEFKMAKLGIDTSEKTLLNAAQ